MNVFDLNNSFQVMCRQKQVYILYNSVSKLSTYVIIDKVYPIHIFELCLHDPRLNSWIINSENLQFFNSHECDNFPFL